MSSTVTSTPSFSPISHGAKPSPLHPFFGVMTKYRPMGLMQLSANPARQTSDRLATVRLVKRCQRDRLGASYRENGSDVWTGDGAFDEFVGRPRHGHSWDCVGQSSTDFFCPAPPAKEHDPDTGPRPRIRHHRALRLPPTEKLAHCTTDTRAARVQTAVCSSRTIDGNDDVHTNQCILYACLAKWGVDMRETDISPHLFLSWQGRFVLPALLSLSAQALPTTLMRPSTRRMPPGVLPLLRQPMLRLRATTNRLC
jgi:hypothetical protein